MANRILGMGDVMTLIEKAEQAYDADMAQEAAAKLMEGRLTLEDFLEQMQAIKKMGPLNSIIGMLPGVPKELKNVEIEDREIARVEAMIRSMTPAERIDPNIVDGSRRSRIAAGSGTTTADVNQLLKQFKEMQKMMKGFGGRAMVKRAKGNKKKKKGGRVTASS
jgi:signal recognition particle subunit SRP54